MHPIPLNDLQRHIAPLSGALSDVVQEVINSGRYVLGPWCERFEMSFAAYCGAQYAVGVASGTDALELALKACGLGAGDEVMTVANAGGYATTAILHTGARPVYVDIDPDTFLMTAQNFAQAITPSTKAVIVTHLYGLMADMPGICKAAAARGITVIEDCAQAHGASIQGKKAGTWGALGCYSFYPSKNLGALGDAGGIITNDATLASRLRALRHYGWDEKYHLPGDVGCNSRMDELQAAVLTLFLPHLDGWNEKRRSIIHRYRAALGSKMLAFQQVEHDEHFAAHLCVVRSWARDRLADALREGGIATDIHYPVPDIQQPAFLQRIGQVPSLPITQQAAAEMLTLPCFPEMTEAEVDYVIAAVKRPMLG